MNPKFLQIGNQKIAYYESDCSSLTCSSPAVVFIHGNSSSGCTFKNQLNSPLANKYRLIAIDLPGHGSSETAKIPKETYTLSGYAGIIETFTRQLSLEDSVFVGWSLGGHILLEAAERLSEATGFVILGTPPISTPSDFAEAFLPHPAGEFLFKGGLSEKEIDVFAASCFCPEDPQISSSLKNDIRQADPKAREYFGKSIMQGNFTDEIEITSNLKTPLAIIHGEKDQLINISYLLKLRVPSLWRKEPQIIAGASHTPHLEQPEKFNMLLIDFIQDAIH